MEKVRKVASGTQVVVMFLFFISILYERIAEQSQSGEDPSRWIVASFQASA
jgi:hypothetical protein